MQINTVGVEYRRKFNLGNYESLELSISFYSKVDLDEDADVVAEFLWHQAKASVKAQVAPVLGSVNYRAQAHYKAAGAPIESEELDNY